MERKRRGLFARIGSLYGNQLFHEGLWFYIFVAIPLVLFALFKVYPTFRTILMSFQRWGFFKFEWIGLKNFTDVLTDWIYWKAFVNTILYSFWTVSLQIIETFVLAYLISRFTSRVQTFFRAVFYLPGLVGAIVMSIIWIWIFSPVGGLLNWLIGLVGIEHQLWLWDTKWALFSLIFMRVVSIDGVGLLLFLAAIAGIPKTLYEVADLDGASRFRQAFRITFPLIKPLLLYVAITGTMSAMNMFEQSWLLTPQGGPGFSTMTLVYYILQAGWTNLNFGSAAAQTVLLALWLLIISVVQFRYFASNVEY